MKQIIKSIRCCLKETILTPIMMVCEVLMEVLIPYIVSLILGFLYILNGNPGQANELTLNLYDKYIDVLGPIGLISIADVITFVSFTVLFILLTIITLQRRKSVK